MRPVLGCAILTAFSLAFGHQARAHEGPPFPIVMNRRAGPYVISVWTDPDVGIGTFYVILEPVDGSAPPEENVVQVCVQPVSGRLPEACFVAIRQHLRDRVQYLAEVSFDQQEMWRVRVNVASANGTGEVEAEVEATPPGYGVWDLLIYGFPFVLFGGLWLLVALRRRIARSQSASAPLERATCG